MQTKPFTLRYYVGNEAEPRAIVIPAYSEQDARGRFSVMREQGKVPGLAPAGY